LYPAAAVTCALPGAAGAAGPSGWTVWWNQEDRPGGARPVAAARRFARRRHVPADRRGGPQQRPERQAGDRLQPDPPL